MIPTTKVAEVLFEFVKANFKSEVDTATLNMTLESALFNKLHGFTVLRTEAISLLPIKEKELLQELLSQYLMFLTIMKNLDFPDDFLDDCSHRQIGHSFLNYILENSFPFPQTLPY